MRRSLIIGLTALAMGLLSSSCIDQLVPVDSAREQARQDGLCTITATIASDATKTALSGLNIVWSTGDVIKVFSNTKPEGVDYTLSDGAGQTTATFTGEDLGVGPFYAVYPASGVTGSLTTTVSITTPAVQTYASNSFGQGANIAVAVGDDKDALQFSNVGGLLRLTITGTKKVNAIHLYTNGTDVLNGTATVDHSTTPPTISYPAFDGTNGTVKLDCSANGGVQLSGEGTPFYFFLPTGTMASGYQVEIIDTDGKAMLKAAQASAGNVIERSVIRPMPAFAYDQQYHAAFLEPAFRGAWSGVNASSTLKGCSFVDNVVGSQCAKLSDTQYRVQNWTSGVAITLNNPATIPALGGSTTLTVSKALGNTNITAADDISVTAVKKFGDYTWFTDANGNGYVYCIH